MTEKIFNNQSEMEKYLNSIAEKVIDSVSDNLLKHLQDILEETVYAPHKNKEYKPLKAKGGFWSGWEIEKSKNYIRTLLFKPEKLVLDAGQGSHVGNWDKDGDIRRIMPDVLNDFQSNIEHSNNYGAHYLRKNDWGYWDIFKIGLNREISLWFDEEFAKYGIRRG